MGSAMEIAFMRGASLEVDEVKAVKDYEFLNYPHPDNYFQNYYLFSWLNNHRYGLVPREDYGIWRNKTRDFFKALENLIHAESKTNARDWYTNDKDIGHLFGMWDMGYIIYPVALLLEFDCDQVQITPKGPQPEGYTYRDQFSDDLLPALEYAKEHDWPFIIFGFD